MTKLAVSIMVHDAAAARATAARAAELGADLVEYRIDNFTDHPEAIIDLVANSPLPCIITCRPTWEGGEYDGTETDRISLIERIGTAPHPPAYFDIELKAYQSSANLKQKVNLVVDHPGQVRPTHTGLILSSHDFETRPADLTQKVAAMADEPACRVIKVAWRARSLRDNTEAFELLAAKYKPTVALCMGEVGLSSRVLAKKFGALLTFAVLDKADRTAPGQPTLEELKTLYRWDQLQADTRVYGVIGHPVGHSMSPPIHNAGFDAIKHDGVYLPMDIAPSYEAFKATVDNWLEHKPLHFRGASVTIPHKENLIRFVREMGGDVDPLAEQIGAANTLVVRDDRSLLTVNTDLDGALDAVSASLGVERQAMSGKRIAVIGAGGAARAIVAGFAQLGATVVIYNRTLSKAEALVEAFNDLAQSKGGKVVAAALDSLPKACAQVFINCTPIGMHPNEDASPIADDALPQAFGEGTVVFDTIYNPLDTKLLKQARAAGCTTIPGTEMFTRQAAAQFKHWTGHDAPLDIFEQVLLERLGH